MKIAYKTRQMRTPQGLSRVWFCAHPDDYEKYLEKISSELLGAASCAVWYDEKPCDAYDPDELCETIESMNLLVVPVTRKLIFSACRASDIELTLALRAHVPVLPILTEQGLEEDFNKRFGSLQLLDRTNSDRDAMSYTDKLVMFLSETLIDEELTQKIRAAFDAYIFLSYRKKDRKYARELMQLIHSNEFCRDIAIWYDEFLLPGEKFNDAIRQAINKSQLFVLNVTPSILEKTTDRDGNESDNYVLAIEYPLALESKKTVLPTETVKTDRAELAQKYKELPPCVDADDTSALSERLLCAFDNIALRKSDGDPQHNFFIGLAYLNGIDVEKNPPLALSLIESAAVAGVTQAIEKLVYMYKNGESVARDVHLEETWRRRLVSHREELFKQSCDAWDAHMWLCEIMYLGDLYMREGQHRNAEHEYERAEELSRALCAKFDNPLAKKDVSSVLYRLGFLAEAQADLATAVSLYERSCEISESFTRKSSSFLVKRDHARDVIALARIFEANEDYTSANDNYVKAYDILTDAAFGNDFSFLLSDLAYVCERLGDIKKKLGIISEARKYLLQALELHRKNEYMPDSAPSMRKAASVLLQLGDLSRSENDATSAKERYREAIKIYTKISDSAPASALEELALALCKLATIADEDEAVDSLKQSLSVYERLLCEYPDNTFYAECFKDIAEGLASI